MVWGLLTLCSVQLAVAQYSHIGISQPEPDSLKADSLVDSAVVAPKKIAPPANDERGELMKQALLWVRRLLYRGFLDNSTSGASATYALTEWNETAGPQGPVIAHVTIVYLGAASWLGKPAEWFQATYKSFENERPTVDFDLVLAENGGHLAEAYRALWRMDDEELTAVAFNDTRGAYDFDREDTPQAGEQTVLKLFAGEFPVTKYVGSGVDGAKVVAYRATDVPPLDIVRLGYGRHSLNLRSRASDVLPKLEVPLPTSR